MERIGGSFRNINWWNYFLKKKKSPPPDKLYINTGVFIIRPGDHLLIRRIRAQGPKPCYPYGEAEAIHDMTLKIKPPVIVILLIKHWNKVLTLCHTRKEKDLNLNKLEREREL